MHIFQATSSKEKNQQGFSLMEMLVVIAITVLFLSMMLLYTRTGGQQIIIFREQANFIANIERARSNSVQRIQPSGQRVCGYGVSFSDPTHPNTYVFFRALPDATNSCTNFSYSGDFEALETITVDSRIRVTHSVTDLLFVPPEPRVFFDGTQSLGGEATFTFSVSGSSRPATVTINSGGQIVAR